MNIVKFQVEEIDVNDAISSIISDDCGGISTFIGTTRNFFNKLKVIQLEYEIFTDMAYAVTNSICERVKSNWPEIKNIIIIHRIGIVPVGQISVLIATTSPHRSDSIEATTYLINEIKKSVPIWKKEIYEDGKDTWKENIECEWNKK